jgi:hypothetical protein
MSPWSATTCAVIPLLFAACAPSAQLARPIEPPRAPPELPTIPVSYEVSRGGDADGIILAGRTDAAPRQTIGVEQQAGTSREKQELKFRAEPRSDGSVVVEVRWSEVSAEGTHITWEPTVHVTRGTAAVAEIKGAGWSRAVRLRLL